MWLSIFELRKIHDGTVAFHHHGFGDEYAVIAAFKADLDSNVRPIESYYFCDEKTGTIMTNTIVKAAAWCTFMARVETHMEVGIVPSTDLLQYVEQRH